MIQSLIVVISLLNTTKRLKRESSDIHQRGERCLWQSKKETDICVNGA
nr:MAG TPA: hypothetical protein [Caudoviricetes sp.]